MPRRRSAARVQISPGGRGSRDNRSGLTWPDVVWKIIKVCVEAREWTPTVRVCLVAVSLMITLAVLLVLARLASGLV